MATTTAAGSAGTLLVASSNKRVLDFFDIHSGEKLSSIPEVIAQPHEMAADPRRRVAYLSHTYRSGAYGQDVEKAHEISVIDVDGRGIVHVIDTHPFLAPHDVEYDRVNDVLYASVERNAAGQNGVIVIDPTSLRVVDSIPVEARNCHWMALASAGDAAYVAHKEEEFISVIDLQTRKVHQTIPLHGGAEEIDVSPDGAYIYVASPTIDASITPEAVQSSQLLTISTETGSVVNALPLEPINHAVRAAPDGRVLVSQMRPPGGREHGTVKVVDRDGATLLATVEVGRWPFTIRITPDSSTAFVANFGEGTVAVLDLETLTVVRTLESTPDPVFGGTHAMCFMPL